MSTSRATLQADNTFRFEGKSCGTWCFTGDKLIVISFRAGGGDRPMLNHIFMETTTKDCWRLVPASDAVYGAVRGATHNNKDTEIVLLIKVPEEIEFADVFAGA